MVGSRACGLKTGKIGLTDKRRSGTEYQVYMAVFNDVWFKADRAPQDIVRRRT
jgi:hypothetical protein